MLISDLFYLNFLTHNSLINIVLTLVCNIHFVNIENHLYYITSPSLMQKVEVYLYFPIFYLHIIIKFFKGKILKTELNPISRFDSFRYRASHCFGIVRSKTITLLQNNLFPVSFCDGIAFCPTPFLFTNFRQNASPRRSKVFLVRRFLKRLHLTTTSTLIDNCKKRSNARSTACDLLVLLRDGIAIVRTRKLVFP